MARAESGKKTAGKGRGNNTPVAADLRTFASEFVAEIDGGLSSTEADELARRHGLTRVSSREFSADRGNVRTVPHH